jgi:alpha-glucosidase
MTNTAWWRGAVIYQIYPRSFADSNGDGIGDLPGITARLPYIAALGVDAIWLSPIFTSPMRDFGYDVADYRAIDPMFGTLADFDVLVAEAHRRGLKIIIDQVYSHSSTDHSWFQASRQSRSGPYADYYVWADPRPDGTPPNNWLAVFGDGAWEWEPRRGQYYLHNFLVSQPDLNLHNPAVQDEILAIARFWLDRGVDGFRLDVANFYTHDKLLRDNPSANRTGAVKPYDMQWHVFDRSRPETLPFIARLRALLDSYPDRMAVAEISSDHPVPRMAEYTSGPTRLHTAYSFVFLTGALTPARIARTVARLRTEAPDAWPSWAFENHDVPRSLTRWLGKRPPESFARTLIALLTTLRGTAFLYQGQELGLPQAELPFEALRDPEGIAFWPAHKGRDGSRTPIPWTSAPPHAGFSTASPWLPVPEAHLPLSAAAQEQDPHSLLHFVRHFLAWRRWHPALRGGEIRFLPLLAPLLAFTRGEAEAGFTLVFNLGEATAELPWPHPHPPAAFELGAIWSNTSLTLPPGTAAVLAGVHTMEIR